MIKTKERVNIYLSQARGSERGRMWYFHHMKEGQ